MIKTLSFPSKLELSKIIFNISINCEQIFLKMNSLIETRFKNFFSNGLKKDFKRFRIIRAIAK